MTPPSAKKRKTSGAGTVTHMAPIIFKSPDLKADMRIKVFGQEYHVHSTILKLYSAYFRKFLDSSEKTQVTALTATQFRYDYISIVDDDGEWGLEPVSMADVLATTRALRKDLTVEQEQGAFGRVFKAMYNIPYDIKSVEELKTMTRLADFYRTLPIVSASLYRAICGNSALGRSIWDRPFDALPIAKKLRHPILFREALIHVIGDDRWEYLGIEKPFEDDEELNNIAFRAHSQFCKLKMKADHQILYHLIGSDSLMGIVRSLDPPENLQNEANYYRQLRGNLKTEDEEWVNIVEAIDQLLQNNLALSKFVPSEEGFFCGDIEDKDMPWDPTETDW